MAGIDSRLNRAARLVLPALTAGALVPSAAYAYVGPGAGLAFLGSVIAVVLAVVIALVALVLFPLRLLRKTIKQRGSLPDEVTPLPDSAESPNPDKL